MFAERTQLKNQTEIKKQIVGNCAVEMLQRGNDAAPQHERSRAPIEPTLVEEAEDVAVVIGPEAGLGRRHGRGRIGNKSVNLEGFGTFGEEDP